MSRMLSIGLLIVMSFNDVRFIVIPGVEWLKNIGPIQGSTLSNLWLTFGGTLMSYTILGMLIGESISIFRPLEGWDDQSPPSNNTHPMPPLRRQLSNSVIWSSLLGSVSGILLWRFSETFTSMLACIIAGLIGGLYFGFKERKIN